MIQSVDMCSPVPPACTCAFELSESLPPCLPAFPQVRDNVEAVLQGLGLAASPLAEQEAAALAAVRQALASVQGVTWDSGLPENN